MRANQAAERTTRGCHLHDLRETDAFTSEKREGEAEGMSEITAGKKRFVKRMLSEAQPTIWVGKSGVSETVLKEVGKQLDKNKMVKVRILESALAEDNAKQIALKVAEQTESSLVEVRGHIFMLYKRRKK